MFITANSILIDFNEEIEYSQDQANVTYPTVFPTVTFMLKETDDLIKEADQICGGDCEYEFLIGINGFTKTGLDNCIKVNAYYHRSFALD